VVDLGSGAGYFALKMAPRVAPNGRVLAVDLRRESLAFLWIRARLDGYSNLHVIHSRVDDPMLPPGPIDAVLIANTYHELTTPDPILKSLFASMRSGARLVVVDREPREGHDAGASADLDRRRQHQPRRHRRLSVGALGLVSGLRQA
jgi:ubiquinone/menaquinone biosynthesis C-methylase UbiE